MNAIGATWTKISYAEIIGDQRSLDQKMESKFKATFSTPEVAKAYQRDDRNSRREKNIRLAVARNEEDFHAFQDAIIEGKTMTTARKKHSSGRLLQNKDDVEDSLFGTASSSIARPMMMADGEQVVNWKERFLARNDPVEEELPSYEEATLPGYAESVGVEQWIDGAAPAGQWGEEALEAALVLEETGGSAVAGAFLDFLLAAIAL